jgi:predicted transcriptional regulator
MLPSTVKGYAEAAAKAPSSLFHQGSCILYELLIDPLYLNQCRYSDIQRALTSFNLLTERLTSAIEKLQRSGILVDEVIEALTNAAKIRERISALCSQLESADLTVLKKSLIPLF